MPKFEVCVPEVHISRMLVEARTMNAAIRAVRDGGGDEGGCDYKDTLDPEDRPWVVTLLQGSTAIREQSYHEFPPRP